jgi:hypothetical protein
MTCAWDEAELPATVSEDELIGIVRGQRPSEDRRAALRELILRRSLRRGPVLRELVIDPSASSELRSAAAIALGSGPGPENEQAVIEALDAGDPDVVRRAAESLGRIGGADGLEALRRLRAEPGGGTGRAVGFARTLIAYRLGLPSERLQPPPASELLEIRRDRADPLVFHTVDAEAFRAARQSLEEALPAIAVAETGSLRTTCRSEHLWIVISGEIAGENAGRRLAERGAVAAVVLKEFECPEGWDVYEYILSHPVEDGRAAIFGVRPTGVLCHYGEMQISGARVRIQLQAVNTPLVPAIAFSAEYDGSAEAFVMLEARLATGALENQRQPNVPRAS